MKKIRITDSTVSLCREPLASPFGFKGAYITELWQAQATVRSDNFTFTVPSTQSVLWSDANVFARLGAEKGDETMLALTKRASELICGRTFETPSEITNTLVSHLAEYARGLCGFDVKTTFVLNSLVGLDIALWSVYAAENGIQSFDGMIPDCAASAMSAKNSRLAQIPLVSYGVDEKGIKDVLDRGSAILKIKIGAPGSKESHEADMKGMLEADCARLSQIHAIASRYETPLTKSGNVCYYLDANSRYDTKDRLAALLDYADRHGILDRIAMLEEPFAEESDIDVTDLPVTVNADESAHSVADVKRRISQGYRAIALKPIAKTMSVSFEMAAEAIRSGCACFCADLTVNPYIALWNRLFASHLPPLPVMNCGCVEINGDTNYKNWSTLLSALPDGIVYTPAKNGAFDCSNDSEVFKKLTGR